MINYKEIDSSMIESIKDIYRKEGWNAYLKDDEKLIRAFNSSLYILKVDVILNSRVIE